MPRKPSKDELKGIVQKMIDANESEENIATVIKKAQESPDVFEMLTSPLVPQIADAAHAIADHIDAPKQSRSEGEARVYGFIAGATGAAGDLVAGFTSPIGIAMTLAGLGPESRVAEAVPALKGLLKIPAVKTLQSAVQGGSSAGFAAKGAYDAVTAPTTEGKLLGASQAASGAAGFALGAPEATLKSTRAVGQTLVDASKRPGYIRAGAIGVMGGAAAAGHPGVAASALPMMMLPQAMKAAGNGIIRLGTPMAEMAAEIPGKGPIPVNVPQQVDVPANAQSQYAGTVRTRLGKALDKVPNQATDQLSDLDAAIAARNDEATATRAASAKQELTGRKAEERADYEDLRRTQEQQADNGVDPRIAQLMARNRGMTAETAQRALALSDQPAVGGPVRPPITPVGKAAADLANGPVAKARPPYNQQAAAENIANGSSYNNGHVLQDPKPTELSDLATEGPDTGMVYDAEHGVAVPRDLSFEAGHPDVPGLTVGKAGTNPLSNRPTPAGSIRVGKGPLDDILGPEGPKKAFDWPEAGGRFEPDATGSHVLKSSRTPASNFGEFMTRLDDAMGGAKSKSKKGSGQWKNLSDNDATTAANAYSTGVRNPEDVIQAILDKRKARQSVHIESHYANQQQIPE